MSADPPCRLGIVGCGAIAAAYAETLAGMSELQLVALVDTDGAALRRMVEKTGVPGHASVRDLVDRERLDAALVLTPPSSHQPVSRELLRAGLHVFCEKPLATNLAAAETMLQAAAQANRCLMMGSKFRYVADMIQARRFLDDQLVGEVLLFECLFSSRVDMSARWNAVGEISGGGVLIDNGCHCADIARFLLGPITRVRARLQHHLDLEVEDTAQMVFEVQSGAMGSVELSWAHEQDATSYVRVYGSRGILEIGWTGSRYFREGSPRWTEFGTGYEKMAALRGQLRNFAATILGTDKPMITADDALTSVKVIDAAYRSATDNQWIEVS